jgi:hypothetical protein
MSEMQTGYRRGWGDALVALAQNRIVDWQTDPNVREAAGLLRASEPFRRDVLAASTGVPA